METKENLIKQYLDEPYKVGDIVTVMGLGIKNKQSWGSSAKIEKIQDDGVLIKEYKSLSFYPFDKIKKNTYNIGLNPFQEDLRDNSPRSVSFSLESIYYALFRDNDRYTTEKGFQIKNLNWNPFVELNGKKEYYQRDFVWTLEDKQLLIDSIYNGVACGSVIIRKRGFDWLDQRESEDDCYFIDIVDGKQRMNTVHEFITGKFCDSEGRYYKDFSRSAQQKFTNHQLFAYFEFDESAKDEAIIQQFLKVNFTGKPQSKKHIEFVKSLLK